MKNEKKNGKKPRIAIILAMAGLLVALSVCVWYGIQSGTVPVQTVAGSGEEVQIVLRQNGSSVSGGGASVSGNIVTVSKGGNYRISGTLEEGQIYVNAGSNETVVLILDGADITNLSDAAIYVENAGQTILLLEEDSENRVQSGKETEIPASGMWATGEGVDEVSDASADEEDGQDASGAAVYAKDDLSVTGSGSLQVFGYLNNGIHTKNNLTIESGRIEVQALNNGIKGKDSVTVTGGDLSIVSGGDGIKSDDTTGEGYGVILVEGGNLSIQSGGDGMQAETSLTISGGDFRIVAGGGSGSMPSQMQGSVGDDGGIPAMPQGDDGDMPFVPQGDRGDVSFPAQGDMPAMTQGDEGGMPSMPQGERDDMPPLPQEGEGGMPSAPQEGGYDKSFGSREGDRGGMPSMPQGEEGDVPTVPQGEEGNRPSAPQEGDGDMPFGSGRGDRGDMPSMPQGDDGDMPSMPQGGRGNMPSQPPGGWGNQDSDWDLADLGQTSAKGLKSGGTLTITGGTFQVDSYDDAVHSNDTILISGGSFLLATGDDGVHADVELRITDGELQITESYEGLEANQISIEGGSIDLVSRDDGINANGGSSNGWGWGRSSSGNSGEDLPCLTISGGTIKVDAKGDGLDSNGNIFITGGMTTVDGPSDNMNGAIDSGSENGGICSISGGTIIAVGSSGMAETFSGNSEQCSFLYALNSGFSAGSEIVIYDEEGNVLFRHTAVRAGSSVVFSSPELVLGESYTLSVDGQTAEITLDSVSASNGRRGRR